MVIKATFGHGYELAPITTVRVLGRSATGRIRSVSGLERLIHEAIGKSSAFGRRLRIACIDSTGRASIGTPGDTGGFDIHYSAQIHGGEATP